MIVKYKGPDTDDEWKLVDGVHRTDFDYLNALSLTNLPEPRYCTLMKSMKFLSAAFSRC